MSSKVSDSPLFKSFPVAVFLHAVLIFATGFMMPEPSAVRNSTLLDITLVNTASDRAPDKADYLAQANQQGSGSLDKKQRLQSRSASSNPTESDGDQLFASDKTAPQIVPIPEPQMLTTKGVTKKQIVKKPVEEKVEQAIVVSKQASEKAEEISRLMAELSQQEQRYAKRPRIHFLDSLSAKTSVEAEYIHNWAKKLERIGNINFPEEALRLSLSGTLIMNVTLNRAGRVVEMQVSRTSGSKVLDKAAKRIVKLAAPYQPLPSEIRRKYDRLNITRSIVFHKKNGQTSFYTN